MRALQILANRSYIGFMIVLCFISVANAELYPNFVVSQNPASPDSSIVFDASISTISDPGLAIVRYEWDWDLPGASASNPNWIFIQSNFMQDATGINVAHSYAQFGVYNPVLRITDTLNNVAYALISLNVLLGNQRPVANSGGPYVITASGNLLLNGSGSYDPNAAWGDAIVEYLWTIGSQTFSDPNPSLTYDQLVSAFGSITTGTQYEISLEVTDSFGATGVSSSYLYVNSVPEPTTMLLLGLGLIGVAGVRRFS
jgi:hypothetical protein